jgi:hypothetical protein
VADDWASVEEGSPMNTTFDVQADPLQNHDLNTRLNANQHHATSAPNLETKEGVTYQFRTSTVTTERRRCRQQINCSERATTTASTNQLC